MAAFIMGKKRGFNASYIHCPKENKAQNKYIKKLEAQCVSYA